MIAKGKSISHTKMAIAYGWNQDKEAEIVFKQHIIGETPTEISNEFKMIQDLNYRCKCNTLSFIISPTIKDGERLRQNDFRRICKKFIKELNLKDRQAIAFIHQDKKHKHIHLYVNRIDFNGVAYKDNFISKKSQYTAEKVAEQLKLTTVKQVQFEKQQDLKEIRTEIKRRHDLSMQQFKPRSFDEYLKAMQTNGVKVIPSINKSNQLRGFRFEFDRYNLKGSEVHRNMSIINIGKQINKNPHSLLMNPKTNQVNLLGNVLELSQNIALKITKKIITKTIEQSIGF